MAEETVMFSLRMPRNLKARLDGAARLDRRSTASLLQVIAQAWLDRGVYQPTYDPALSATGPQLEEVSDLRPAPGRPRTAANPRIDVYHIRPTIVRMIGGKERLSDPDVIGMANALSAPNAMQLVREVLFREGWREYRNRDNEPVWTKLSA